MHAMQYVSKEMQGRWVRSDRSGSSRTSPAGVKQCAAWRGCRPEAMAAWQHPTTFSVAFLRSANSRAGPTSNASRDPTRGPSAGRSRAEADCDRGLRPRYGVQVEGPNLHLSWPRSACGAGASAWVFLGGHVRVFLPVPRCKPSDAARSDGARAGHERRASGACEERERHLSRILSGTSATLRRHVNGARSKRL